MTSEFIPPDSEFEHLLRRHLRQQAGREPHPREACPGFDPDRAASYLERALSGVSLERYEAHLAVCPLCRTQLAQFTQWVCLAGETAETALHPGNRSLVPDRWWESLYLQIKGQLAAVRSILQGERGRPFGAGPLVAGTAFALLVAIVGWQLLPTVRSDRQSDGAELAQRSAPGEPLSRGTENRTEALKTAPPVASDKRPPGPSEKGLAQLVPPETGVRSASPASSAREGRTPGSPPGSRVPRAARPPADQADTVALLAQEPSVASFKSPEVPILKPTLVGTVDRSPGPDISDIWTARSSDLTTRIPPLSRDNPMSSVGSESVPPPERRTEGGQLSRRVSGFIASGKGSSPLSSPSERLSAPPTRRILDKTFYLTGGTWVDDLYFGNLRVRGTVRLTAGSEEYAAVLQEHPELAEYFQLRPVTVVWRGIVYRVTP
ncbi:MAG: hypothetical protein ACOYNR_06050 [Blastocatellia bacterium]